MPITIKDLAKVRGIEGSEPDTYSYQDYLNVGLDMLGGYCEVCHASIAAYNAYPSKTGYWRCRDCIGGHGWDDAVQANAEIFA